jgi:hypothetical protein
MTIFRRGDIEILTFDALARVPGLVHAASARAGGVSAPPFDSLNLGFRVGDREADVVENRRRFAAAAGFRLEDVVTTRQVHGVVVRTVGAGGRGTGALKPPGEAWDCDALVTREPGVTLMAFAADCPLALLVDPEARVAGLAHAGWRSTFGGILARTVEAMTRLGAEPGRIVAGVSPAAQACCYEVGGELRDALAKTLSDADRFFRPLPRQNSGQGGDKFMLDLPGVVREMLIREGIRTENIEDSRACTICSPRGSARGKPSQFFSHRASGGKTGRLAAVIGWALL